MVGGDSFPFKAPENAEDMCPSQKKVKNSP